jgi:hypothetical protein
LQILDRLPLNASTTSVEILFGHDADFNSTTITLAACKYADKTATSLVWKKSAVLKAEAEYQKSLEGWDWD